jgi:transcriptional regulator with XRE-family HTH domain
MTEKEWRRKFSTNLLLAMGDADIPMTRLAVKAGISYNQLNKYLACESTPRVTIVINLAKVLGVSVEELVDFGEKVNKKEVTYGQHK